MHRMIGLHTSSLSVGCIAAVAFTADSEGTVGKNPYGTLVEKKAIADISGALIITMSVVRTSVHAKWIVGKVIGTKMRKTAKVRVTRMVLDSYLLKYFNKRKTYFAHDAEEQCTVGDIVLLKALPERRSKHVTHELSEIVFKVGRVVDPLTGKLCAGSRFIESLEDINVDDLDKQLQSLKLTAGISEEKAADS